MTDMHEAEYDLRDLHYRTRVEVMGEIVDGETGEVVAQGREKDMRALYRVLRRRAA